MKVRIPLGKRDTSEIRRAAVLRPGHPGRYLVWIAVVLGLFASIYVEQSGILGGYVVLLLQLMGIYAIEAMGLGLINGFTGQFSLGHATFMGIGAYTAALVTSNLGLPFLPALLLGGLAAGAAALLLGIPVFRLLGDYVVVITLAINLIFVNLLNNFGYAGGPRGFSVTQAYDTLPWIYAWVVITYVVLRNLVFSSHGRALLAVREDETAAPLLGVNPYKYKLIAFSLACFFAGVGGALSAHTLMFIAPPDFSYLVSIDILVMTLLGGSGSLFGAILGAVTYRVVLELLRPLGVWRMLVTPVLLFIIIMVKPTGLYGQREPRIFRDRWGDGPIVPGRRVLGVTEGNGTASS